MVSALALGVPAVAWAVWCNLSAGNSIFAIYHSTQDVSTDWQQWLNCSSGVNPNNVCYTCLTEKLFYWDPSTQSWTVTGKPYVGLGSVNCNTSGVKQEWTADFGGWPPGYYDIRSSIYQGGQCTVFITSSDHTFTITQ